MRKHFLLFSLLFVLLPFFTTQAQENKAINIPQLNINWSTSAYRLEVPETILGDRNGGETDRTGKSFTLSAWINMDQFTNGSYNNKGNVIMGHGARFHFNYNGSLVLATTTDGTLKIIAGASNTSLAGNLNASIELNTWTYLTLVYDNSDYSVKVYKDGTLVDTRNKGSQLELFGDDPCIFYVGGTGFSGLCDEMQFYNKALTADEVAQAYNNNPQGVSGLTAWYDFNEIESGTTGTFANKATGSAHADTKAVFYNLSNATLSRDGGYTSIKAFTETAPTLAEGRTIETTTMYTVTVPETVENGTLSVMSGETALNAGENQVEAGTELTITATPNKNYFVESLTVNDAPVENGGTYVVNEDATIAVSFAEIEMHNVSVAIDESVDYQIAMNGEPVEDLTSIVAGSKLTLTINALPQGKKLVSVTLGDEPLEANEDGTYTFTVTDDATLTVTLADIAYYTVTLPETVENGTLSVMNGDVALNPGENTQIEEGTTLTITATPNSGYEILSLQVNGEDFTSGNTYVVNQNVTITASFQFEGPKAVLVPEISGQYKYQFRFDDKVLGEHENGVNNSWNNGNVTGTDHRARNFTMSAWIKAVSTGGDGQILGHGQSLFYNATGTFGVFLNNGRLTLKARSWEDGGSCPGIAEVATNATLTTDEWAFISVVVDDVNKTIKLYKNGKLAGTGDLATIVENGVREGHGIGLLQDECVFFVGNGGFSCYVDEVQVWTKALDEKELKESIRGGYTQENMPQELVAYYKIENDSEAELENKGTYGACPAGVVEGTTQYSSTYWTDVYTCNFISVQIVEGHTFPTNNLTITQPTEGGTFKVVNAQNEEVTDGPIDQFTALTVVAEPAEGYRLDKVLVNGEENSGTTFVIEDDTEVTVIFTNQATVSYTTAAHGQVEMFIDDATEATAFGEVTLGSKVTLKATPDEGYELTSLLINGEEKIDEVSDNTYTIASLDDDVTVEAAFSEKVLYWQITCMVEGNGTVTIYDEEGTQYPSGYSQIPSNVAMRLEFEPAEGYEIVDFYETDAEGETTSLLTQIQSNVYNIGRLTSNHIYNVKFSAISGIDETIDALSIYCNAGMLYVNGLGENTTIEIYDITGKLVKVAHEAPVNVSDLHNGCYIVKVAMNNAEKVVKFIKR